jgi:hypothetical protein
MVSNVPLVGVRTNPAVRVTATLVVFPVSTIVGAAMLTLVVNSVAFVAARATAVVCGGHVASTVAVALAVGAAPPTQTLCG